MSSVKRPQQFLSRRKTQPAIPVFWSRVEYEIVFCYFKDSVDFRYNEAIRHNLEGASESE